MMEEDQGQDRSVGEGESEALEQPFDTRAGYLQAVDQVVAAARRELCIFDRNLEKTQLESRDRVQALTDFFAADHNRTLRIVVHDLEYFQRYAPRLMDLLKRNSHRMTVRQTPDTLKHLADSLLLADGEHGAVRFHEDSDRGKWLSGNPQGVQALQRRFEDLWLEALPGVSATQLGL